MDIRLAGPPCRSGHSLLVRTPVAGLSLPVWTFKAKTEAGIEAKMMWCQFPWTCQIFWSKNGRRIGRPQLPARTPVASPDFRHWSESENQSENGSESENKSKNGIKSKN